MLSVHELGTLGLMIGARKQLMPVMLAASWPWPCPEWGAVRAAVWGWSHLSAAVSHVYTGSGFLAFLLL